MVRKRKQKTKRTYFFIRFFYLVKILDFSRNQSKNRNNWNRENKRIKKKQGGVQNKIKKKKQLQQKSC